MLFDLQDSACLDSIRVTFIQYYITYIPNLFVLFLLILPRSIRFFFFFLNNPAPPEISPFPLHAALPIYRRGRDRGPDAAVARRPGACVRQPPRPVHRRARHAARVAAVARPTPWRRHIRARAAAPGRRDRKSTRLNSSHLVISYAVFCLKK